MAPAPTVVAPVQALPAASDVVPAPAVPIPPASAPVPAAVANAAEWLELKAKGELVQWQPQRFTADDLVAAIRAELPDEA